MKRILARCFAIVAAIGVLVVPGTSNGDTGSCQRTIGIDQQESASEGTSTLSFVVHSQGCAAAGSVAYRVTSGSADVGVDVRLPSGVLKWPSGDTSHRRITAMVVQDLEREDALETFTVELVEPSTNVRIDLSIGEGRVADDDDAFPNLPAVLVTDGICDVHGGSPMCDTEFDLTAAPDPVTVHWETEDGTAIAGRDYVAVIDRVQTFSPGVTQAKLRVQALTTPPGTPSRSFVVRLLGTSRGTIVDSRAIITIPGS